MKKKIVAAVLAGVLALTGIVPFIAETFSVRAEEASVIGEWFGNIWGTPAVMTLDKDGAFSIKYDNKDKTELTGKWVQKENQILVNEGTDDDLLIDYDEKKETMTTQSNGETFVFTRDEENAKKKRNPIWMVYGRQKRWKQMKFLPRRTCLASTMFS